MAPTPYPIPRQARQTETLVGTGGTDYGPFGFKIFDVDDVVVWTRRPDDDAFGEESDITVTKVGGASFDDFTITFSAPIDASVAFIVSGERLSERSVAVTKGGAINSGELEKELSKQAVALAETRRDVDRAWQSDVGSPAGRIVPGDEDAIPGFDAAGNLVPKTTVAHIEAAAADAARAEAAAAKVEGLLSMARMASLDTVASLATVTYPAGVSSVVFNGGVVNGDTAPFTMKRLAEAPATPAIIHKQSFDGDWWEIPAADGRLSTAQVGLAWDDADWGLGLNDMTKWLAARGDGWNGGELIINPAPTDYFTGNAEIAFDQQIQMDPRVNLRGLSSRTTRLKWTGGKEPAMIMGDADFRQGPPIAARHFVIADLCLDAGDGANQGHGLVLGLGAMASALIRVEVRRFAGIDAGGNGDLARNIFYVGNPAALGETSNDQLEAHYHYLEQVWSWEGGIDIGVSGLSGQGQTNAITMMQCVTRNARGNPAADEEHAKAYEHYHSGNVHLMNCHNVRLIGGSREMGGDVGDGTAKARYGTSFGPGCHECYDIGAYYEGNFGDTPNPTPFHFQDDATCYNNWVKEPLLSSEWLKVNPENANWSVDPGKRNGVEYRRHDFSADGEKYNTKRMYPGGLLEVVNYDKAIDKARVINSIVHPAPGYANTVYSQWGSHQACGNGVTVSMNLRLPNVDPSTKSGLNGSLWRDPNTKMLALYETTFGGNRNIGLHVAGPASATAAGQPGMFGYQAGYQYMAIGADSWVRDAAAVW